MKPRFDLLGDPIPEGRGEPGRTGHIPTAENARRIRALLVAGLGTEQIAKQLGITAPTLRKHYFSNGKINVRLARRMAVSEMRARNILRLDAEADKGNVSAMRALDVQIDRMERELIEDELGKGERAAEDAPKGKKQIQAAMAHEADDDLMAELEEEANGHRLN